MIETTCKCNFMIKASNLALYEVESFEDSNGLAPVEVDNSTFLLPGVHGRGCEG